LRLVEQERKEQEAVIAGLADVIRQRATTPLDEFVASKSGATRRIAEAALKRGGSTS
jgi:hypothetical protein